MNGFISRREFAAALGVKVATVGAWDRRGRGVGGRGAIHVSTTHVVYRREDVEEWIKKKESHTPEFAPPGVAGVEGTSRARGGRRG